MKSALLYCPTLLYKDNGQIWSFYAFGGSIYYTISKKNTLGKKIKLADNVKSYDISMDTNENIHLVYSKKDGELCYLKGSNSNWKKKTFKKPSSKSIIEDINVFNINDSVHIFYCYKNTTNKKPHKVFHLYNQGNQWRYTFIFSALMSKNNKPYFVDYNKEGEIIVLYKKRELDKIKFFIKAFSSKNCSWSSPLELELNKSSGIVKSFLIDTKNTLHLLYENARGISYLNCSYVQSRGLQSPIKFKSNLRLNSTMGSTHKLFEVDDSLWIAWQSNNSLGYCFSYDFGKSWSEIEEFEGENLFKVKFISHHYKEISLNKPFYTFALSKDDTVYFLGIDNVFLIHEDIHQDEIEVVDEVEVVAEVDEVDEASDQFQDDSIDDEIHGVIDTLDSGLSDAEEKPSCSLEDKILDSEGSELESEDLGTVSDEDNTLDDDQYQDDIKIISDDTMFDECISHYNGEDDREIDKEGEADKEVEKTKKSFIERLKDFLTCN